jgi:hypothetical protein
MGSKEKRDADNLAYREYLEKEAPFEERELRMPWGKHQGKTIEEIPSGYLKWLAENCDQDDICDAADQEYQWRDQHNKHIWE